jgi:AcrR family transcriptional regulator
VDADRNGNHDALMELHHEGGLLGRDRRSLSSDEEILQAALRCFVEKGYHGTTIRSIAARGGLSVPGLYHHFASKAVLLEHLIDDTMDDLITITGRALASAPSDAIARFDAVVTAHVRFHCERPEESFIGNSELRSLSAQARKRMIGKRDRQQRLFDGVVDEGMEAGIFSVEAPHEASRAIVTMCTAVATWYHRNGQLQPDEIVEIYRDLARNVVRYDEAKPARRPVTSSGRGSRVGT